MTETAWLLSGLGAGWLLATISLWIGIVIGVQWRPKENYHIMRPWKKIKKKGVMIEPQTGKVEE